MMPNSRRSMGRPQLALDAFDGGSPSDAHQYGAFVFAEYLTERLSQGPDPDPGVIRATWEAYQVRASTPPPGEAARAAIGDVIGLHGLSVPEILSGFADANYLLDYVDPRDPGMTAVWRAALDTPGTADPTHSGRHDPRAPQSRHGEEVIQRGGAVYLDLAPFAGSDTVHLQFALSPAVPGART